MNHNIFLIFNSEASLEVFSSNKVAVITGGTGVLGSSIAENLGLIGVNVIILGRNQNTIGEITSIINKKGGVATGFSANVLDKKSLLNIRDLILKKFKRIDILLNAVGGNMPGATISDNQTILI
ncbi:MAG: SDR family NAD(P)-dependent oxidoreductase [Flavobacteriaceae bacterium]